MFFIFPPFENNPLTVNAPFRQKSVQSAKKLILKTRASEWGKQGYNVHHYYLGCVSHRYGGA